MTPPLESQGEWLFAPVHQLTDHQIQLWLWFLYGLRELGLDPPLAQTLTWANAMRAVGAQPYLLFSPTHLISGIIHLYRAGTPNSDTIHAHCTNGPICPESLERSAQWDPTIALDGRGSAPMEKFELFRRMATRLLPLNCAFSISPRLQTYSPTFGDAPSYTTTIIPLQNSITEIEARFSRRLRRTIRGIEAENLEIVARLATSEDIEILHSACSQTAQRKKFQPPPLPFMKSLTTPSKLAIQEGIQFPFFSCDIPNNRTSIGTTQFSTKSAILCAEINKQGSHYLFGGEMRSSQNAGLSRTRGGALLHREAIRRAHRNGMRYYDLNGVQSCIDPTHPYYSVSRFKAQFNGTTITYWCPKFDGATAAPKHKQLFTIDVAEQMRDN